MKIKYDTDTDILYIAFSDTFVAESEENIPDFIFDYDSQGNVVGIEVLAASAKLPTPSKIEFDVRQ